MKAVMVLMFLLPAGIAQAAAPFCVVSNAGSQCYYYDLNSCQQAARTMQGLCTGNVQQNPSPTPTQTIQPRNSPAVQQMQLPDYFEAARKGEEAGMQRRQAREQSELNRLQQQALRQQIAQRDSSANAEPDGKALGQIVVSSPALHHACELAQILRGPAAMRLTEDEGLQGFACVVYAHGAYATAISTTGFASPDKSMSFCTPRTGTSAQSLVDALVAAGTQNKALLEPDMDALALLLAAFVSLSSCPGTLR